MSAPYILTVKRSPRARIVHVWTRYSGSLEQARADAARVAREEFGERAVVIDVQPAPALVNPFAGMRGGEVLAMGEQGSR